ncbi:phosphopantetheine-binding protein [uncultured Marinobacter sp.]|uniref:phosphopantetheine-binding protein n=1 Tax=uncultured Marinobacter sp. TaxID=187379 RepID=UPI0025F75F37|nr:phosphopantetheine-binding protein [uncultured Marinobacter sp.]
MTAARDAIKIVIEQHLPNARLAAFNGSARLNADLALDSIMLLQLIVHLELEHGLYLPEEALLANPPETVADLENLLAGCQSAEVSR